MSQTIYFTIEELNPHNYPVSDAILANLQELQLKLSQIRELWGKPMTVNSGLRSENQQLQLIQSGKSKATKSKHLTGQAADISDPDGTLAIWCHTHVDDLETVGLWCESTDYTRGWVHFQIVPPGSGNRFFIP